MLQLSIFGFGSLLDSESLAATVPDADSILPAYIKGFRRDFSFWDSVGWTETNLELAGEAFCAVDVTISRDPGSKVNGVIFQMSELNYERLLQRELGYKLIQTESYSFENNKPLGKCMVFSSNRHNGTYDFESKAQKRYLEICLRGAHKYGKDFYQGFLETTFINDQPLKEISTLAEICNKYS